MERMNNPEGVDYHTTTMEALNGKSRLEDVRGPLGENKFMFTRVIRKKTWASVCQRIYWSKRNSSSVSGWVYSSYACVEVPYDYDVEPSVSVNSDYIDAENVTKIEGINAGLNNKGTSKLKILRMHLRDLLSEGLKSRSLRARAMWFHCLVVLLIVIGRVQLCD